MTDDNEQLTAAARQAAEPIDWDQIADYFDQQRAQVAPRDVRQEPE